MEAICIGGQYDRKIVNVKPPVDVRVPMKDSFTDPSTGAIMLPAGWVEVYELTGNLDLETGLPVLQHTGSEHAG